VGCAARYNSGYTTNMKTAVSVPDELFREAEAAAHRLRLSRSALYAKALAKFLKAERGSAITEQLNELYSRNPAKVDSRLHDAQLKTLKKDAW
jgi:metal-responsive CopG/Arc/MetJ family transcriptional regulator